MGPVLNATGQQFDGKSAKRVEVQKYVSTFENNFPMTEIRYLLKCFFISPWEAVETPKRRTNTGEIKKFTKTLREKGK